MSFDFSIDPLVAQWQQRIRTFIADVVIPQEQHIFETGLNDAVRRELQAAARAAGVWAPQAPVELGGGGFRFDDVAVLLEEAGTSLFGPLAMNCAAPDEGNINLLDVIATAEQRARYLVPLVNGDVRSCFAMTEPVPGAGSDPAALTTIATKVPGGWQITGEKHLITGAEGAAFAIVMARGESTSGATMFIVETNNPAFTVEGHARTIDSTMVGGHCRVRLDKVFVQDDDVLGVPGEGFRNVQVRLAPARLTHCMRWLGAARRAHEIALHRSVHRELFGQRLSDLGMAQQLIADNEIDLAAARALLWHASWQHEQGDKSTESSSRAKVHISEAVNRVVDRSVQLAGGLGTSEDLVIGRIYADIRAFRIYDGASEVHRMSIAKRVARRALAADSDPTA
jgi:acyl-CoA dehydrogenase